MTGRIKPSEFLKAPFIKVTTKVTMPGTTNGKPNIKYEDEYVIAPSGKKIATYINNAYNLIINAKIGTIINKAQDNLNRAESNIEGNDSELKNTFN